LAADGRELVIAAGQSHNFLSNIFLISLPNRQHVRRKLSPAYERTLNHVGHRGCQGKAPSSTSAAR
jgi:hypothetical protein